MNLKSLTDSTLVSSAQTLVREERDKLTAFLHHLKEIERRRLFSSFGYKSLFEMTTRHFGYSEDEAYRRISAMKLLKEIPAVEEKISQGKITLSHLSLAQKHFRQEKKIHSQEMPLSQKAKVIEQISQTSVREAEKITLKLSSSPEPLKPDRIRVVSEDRVEIRFSVSSKTQGKIHQLKGYLAHRYPDLTVGELFDLLCDLGLKDLDPSKKRRESLAKTVAPQKSCVKKSKAQSRREVFLKSNNKCDNCGSGFALEIDHILPKAQGGSDNPENLRLLCRSCNQRAAIQVFGVERMSPYLNR